MCVFWTAVLNKHCGLASIFHKPHPYHRPVRNVGSLTELSALELAQYARSDNILEASIGMAAINSLMYIDEDRCIRENAVDILALKSLCYFQSHRGAYYGEGRKGGSRKASRGGGGSG
jgi:uncharacterized protein (DUF4213/DUF364 family)